jgi:tetratricopeptide (TPR) repeat protein
VEGLAEFYARLGRFAEQAALYEWAAGIEKDKGKKVDFALRAGSAFAKAGEFSKAERILSDAISTNRSDPRPYQYLIRDIYGAKKDLLAAQQAVAEGLRNGAPALDLNLALAEAARKAESPDAVATALAAAKSAVAEAAKEQYPFDLYIQLAEGAGRVGEHEQQLAALLAALELQPTDTDTLSRVANVYLAQGNSDRAVIYLERLANTQYNSADVYFRLAQAEDARYRYAAAGRAYARAVELAPDNKNYQTTYASFKQKVAQNLPKPKSGEPAASSAEAGATRLVQALGKEPVAPSAKGKERRGKR